MTAQVNETTGSPVNCDLWLRKNVTDLIQSTRREGLITANSNEILTINYIAAMEATDTLEIYLSVSSIVGSPGIYANAAGTGPAAPSIMVAITYLSSQ